MPQATVAKIALTILTRTKSCKSEILNLYAIYFFDFLFLLDAFFDDTFSLDLLVRGVLLRIPFSGVLVLVSHRSLLSVLIAFMDAL